MFQFCTQFYLNIYQIRKFIITYCSTRNSIYYLAVSAVIPQTEAISWKTAIFNKLVTILQVGVLTSILTISIVSTIVFWAHPLTNITWILTGVKGGFFAIGSLIMTTDATLHFTHETLKNVPIIPILIGGTTAAVCAYVLNQSDNIEYNSENSTISAIQKLPEKVVEIATTTKNTWFMLPQTQTILLSVLCIFILWFILKK